MEIVEVKVSPRKTPPGACVEFLGRDGESIEIELRGNEFATMTEQEIIVRAKSTMTAAGRVRKDLPDAGVEQTLDLP